MADSEGRELPPNWRTAHADDGKEYYFNELTGETTWSFPAMPPPKKVPPPLVSDAQAVTSQPEPAQTVEPMEEPSTADDSPPVGGFPVGVQSVHSFSKALGSSFPKMLIIFVCSAVVMIQASIEYGKASQEVYVAGVGRMFVDGFPFKSTAYAVIVGTISLFAVFGIVLLARKKPHVFSSFKLKLPRNKGSLSLQQCYAIFFMQWWATGAGILTFHAPYNYTCNAYFACWIACFVSSSMLMSSFKQLGDTWQRVSDAQAADQHLQLDSAIMVCSLAVFFASLDFVDIGQGLWALLCSVFSMLALSASFYLKRTGKAGPGPLKGLALLLLLLWTFGAGVTTFDEPFKATGNGFFASWIALFVSASKTYAILMNKQILWPSTLRRSISMSAQPLTSELPDVDQPSRV